MSDTTKGAELKRVLEYLRVPWRETTNLYVLGLAEKRVTFRDQQVRALNLALALTSADLPGGKRLTDNEKVAVIGGGIAGVTVALALVRRGCRVVLFEKRHRVVDLQSSASHRRIHPHIYDWPREGWQDNLAGLPLLSWSAGDARQVCNQIRSAFEREVEALRGRLNVLTQVSRVEIVPRAHGPLTIKYRHPADNRLGQTIEDTPGSDDFAATVLAVGFGVEERLGSLGSYWTGDLLPNLPPGTDVLVSGDGDGGLIDVLRACLQDFDHDRLEALASHRLLGGIRERLQTVDFDASEVDLSAEIEQSGGVPKAFLEELIPRPGVKVTLNHRGGVLGERASALNRFLTHCLVEELKLVVVESGDLIKASSDAWPASSDAWPPRRNAVGRYIPRIDRSGFSDDDVELEVDELIVRHGPQSALRALSTDIDRCIRKQRAARASAPGIRTLFRTPLWGSGDFHLAGHPEPQALAEFGSAMILGGQVSEDPSHIEQMKTLAAQIGVALAKGGAALIVCSPMDDSADAAAARAYAKAGGRLIDFHAPRPKPGWQLAQALDTLLRELESNGKARVRVWYHRGPLAEDDGPGWRDAWAISQDEASHEADVVIAVGGKMAGTAFTLLHRLDRLRKPLLPVPLVGGAAQEKFDAMVTANDQRLVLNSPDGITRLVELANALWQPKNQAKPGEIKTLFVSRARTNEDFAQHLAEKLSDLAGIEVFQGDDVIKRSPTRPAVTAIDQQLEDADAIVCLWSESYAKSDFCRNELDLAIKRHEKDVPVWIFELDDRTGLGDALRNKLGRGRAATKEQLLEQVEKLLGL